jgi:hypothetical protein
MAADVSPWLKNYLNKQGGPVPVDEEREAIQGEARHPLEGRLEAARAARRWGEVQEIARRIAREETTGEAVGFQPLTFDELIAPIPPIPFLVKGLDMSPGRPAQFVGMGAVGKTIILQAATLAIATGRPVWDTFSASGGMVAHFDYEMGRNATLRRYRRLCEGHGIRWEDVAPNLRIFPRPPLYLNAAGIADHLKRAVDGCAFAWADSLRRCLPGEDENDSSITRFPDEWARVSEETGCTFAFLHHATTKTKPGEDRDSRGAGRGSSALYDVSGSVFVLSGKKGEPIRVEHTRPYEGGICADDFYLSIEDVQGENGDPRAGLRVVHQSVEQIAPTKKPGDAFAMVKSRVLRCVAENPGVAGVEPIAAMLEVRPTNVRAAVKDLLGEDPPRMVNLGSDKKPKYRVVYSPSDTE